MRKLYRLNLKRIAKKYQKENKLSSKNIKKYFKNLNHKPTLYNKVCMALDFKDLYR